MATRWRRLGAEMLVVVVAVAVDLYVYDGDRALRGGGSLAPWVVPVLTVAVFATLLARWRHPSTVFAIVWVHGLAGLVVPGYAPFAGMLVALHATACRARTGPSIAFLAASAVPFVIDNRNASVVGGGWSQFAVLCAVWAVILGAVWAVGRRTYLVEHRASLLRELQARDAAEAVRAERARLARELHDIVAHAVSVMVLQAAGARTLLGTAPAPGGDYRVRDALAAVETTGVTAMKELHRLLGLLRAVDPEGAEDTAGAPGLADLGALVDASRASGLDVVHLVEGAAGGGSPGHVAPGDGPLDRSVDLAAYRVVQEALTNAVKHAGHGAPIRIHEIWEAERLCITARSGRGLHAPGTVMTSSGFGLRGLAERVALVGGRFESGPVDGGFLVRAEFPLERSATGLA